MTREVAPMFELANGFHPLEQRHLTEEEERYPLMLLRWVDHDQILNKANRTGIEELACLWIRLFPNIEDVIRLPETDFYTYLWRELLTKVDPLIIAYTFQPLDLTDVSRYRRVESERRKMQCRVEHVAATKRNGSVIWTLPFPALGPLGEAVEQRTGLSDDIKQELGLRRFPFGFLCNYLLSRDEPMENILSPHQFEDLVGAAFANEGWAVERMKKTRDGGKDAILRKRDGDLTTVAYVQAKRHGSSSKVGLAQVKEFVATVHWDHADKGFLVTTSTFTGPAQNWLRSNGLSPTVVETVDRNGLLAQLARIADGKPMVYLLAGPWGEPKRQ